MRIHLAILAVLVACAGGILAAGKFDPQNTKVAILPVINNSNEKWAELRQKQTDRGNEELAAEFKERGFKLVDSAAVAKAISDLKIDFSDEEEWKKDNLYKVGNAVHADYVVFVAVIKTGQGTGEMGESLTRMKVWFLDVPATTPVMSGKIFARKSPRRSAFDKGSSGQIRAVANCIRDAFEEFLKPYPIVVKVDRS